MPLTRSMSNKKIVWSLCWIILVTPLPKSTFLPLLFYHVYPSSTPYSFFPLLLLNVFVMFAGALCSTLKSVVPHLQCWRIRVQASHAELLTTPYCSMLNVVAPVPRLIYSPHCYSPGEWLQLGGTQQITATFWLLSIFSDCHGRFNILASCPWLRSRPA